MKRTYCLKRLSGWTHRGENHAPQNEVRPDSFFHLFVGIRQSDIAMIHINVVVLRRY